jgi:hypothetical protein
MAHHRCELLKRFPDTENITVKVRLSRKYGEWLMAELRLIKRLHPEFNERCKAMKVENYGLWV